MSIHGVYNGSAVEITQSFPKGQRFLLIPVHEERKPNPDKQRLIRALYGSVPDSGYDYEAVRRERREQL